MDHSTVVAPASLTDGAAEALCSRSPWNSLDLDSPRQVQVTPRRRVKSASAYYASSETYEIRVFDTAGTLERIMRRPIPNDPVTGGDIEAYKEDFVGGDDPRFAAWARRRVNDLEFPETMPAYGSVKVDALGNVWVATYSWRSEDRAGAWTVFDSEGRMLGVVDVPGGGIVRDIGEDYLIGVWRTDLDVEQVRMYRLFRN